MKKTVFCGHSLEAIKQFPEASRRATGHQLDRVQRGLDPLDWKAMPMIGNGVREIRIRNIGQYRVIYVATHYSSVYVLHAFQKKSQKTKRQDIQAARSAFRQLGKRNLL